MNKYIKITFITTLISGLAFLLIQKAVADKNEIKIEPAIEVKNKYSDFAKNGSFCPRTISSEEPILTSDSNEFSEYEHCPSCKMGVFFKNEKESLTCSYCLVSKL